MRSLLACTTSSARRREAAGDPYEEVGCVHVAKALVRAVYGALDRFAARAALGRSFD